MTERRRGSGHGAFQLRPSEDAIRLAARLQASLTESQRVILFTGAAPREGVSTVATQVALALANVGQVSVLLLDANLRTPSLHSAFDVPPSPGLSELVEKKAQIHDVIHPTGVPALSVLPAGNALADPLSLIPRPEFAASLRALRQLFQFLILDAPAMLHFADPILLAARSDAVVIVLATGVRRQSEVLEMKRMLDGVKANVAGVVLREHQGGILARFRR